MQVETYHYELLDDTKKCSNVNLKSKLDECIRNIVKNEGYISCDIRKKAIPADGGNYLAILYEIDVKGKTADGYKDTAIFVKSMTVDSNVIEVISLPDVYKTELFAYKELLKIFNDLQDEANIPMDQRFNTVKCYEDSHEEAIIMENLTRKGFKTWYRMDIVTLDMAEECIKQLGRFHGLSFVLEQRRPDYFAKKIKTLKTAYNFGKAWEEFVEKFYKIGIELVDDKIRTKVGSKTLDILKKNEKYFNDQSIMYCLCHGDYRPNNVMFKEVDGKVTKVVPLDYQLMYFGCPIVDFFYFIYMATDRQFRKAHMISLKNLYYQSLEEFLQHFDISAESVFPRKVFENLYQDKMDYGLMMTFILVPFLFVSEEEEVPDVTSKPIVDIEFKLDKRFRDRVVDNVEEFIELGFL